MSWVLPFTFKVILLIGVTTPWQRARAHGLAAGARWITGSLAPGGREIKGAGSPHRCGHGLTSPGHQTTMTLMLRAIVLAMLFVAVTGAGASQPAGILQIRVALVDADQKATPVPRHVLLISDNPATAGPRRIVTASDGTATVSLRPGSYIVESDQPLTFLGRAYQWTQVVEIAAGGGTTLELTADNAEIGPVTAATATAAPVEADASALLMPWHDSVLAVWTPTAHASGFVVDAKGLVATNQRVIGTATSVEVQLTPAVKVAGTVLVADPGRDVAILQVDPHVLAAVRPVPLACSRPSATSLGDGQEVFTIGTPLREGKGLSSGEVSRIGQNTVVADFGLAHGSTGGPVFAADGGVIGITSVADEKDGSRRGDARVVHIDDVCIVVAAAAAKMTKATPPSARHLPVEPARPIPVEVLEASVERRAGSLSPYQVSSSDFDIAFITPVMLYAAAQQSEQSSGRERRTGARGADMARELLGPLTDFKNWSEYAAEVPPVLLVRVTPKLVEGFWTMVARGAAQTQGVSLPSMKRFTAGFARMRALCGDAEVTPIHPFTIEQRISERDTIAEGLYVFDPGALGLHCGTVKLVLYSEKAPEKGDTRVVDPKLLEQIWQDFAPYRALQPRAEAGPRG
ncbi:MAG: trypsin-like peptidase domain-containing protein [Acidobacteriota bacterium]